MKSTHIRQSILAAWLAVLAVACSESPTSPGGGTGSTVSSVAVTGGVTLTEGQTSQLTATATMSDGTTQVVTSQAAWSSANTAIASVSSTGLVTARATGTAQISAVYQNQTGTRSIQVSSPVYTIRVRAEAITAIGTCDDFTQGADSGEFAIRVRALRTGAAALNVSQTQDYPGAAADPSFHSLARNASLALAGSQTFTMNGAPGQSVTVEFSATEWDAQFFLIPPRIEPVRDGDMNNRSITRVHAFADGLFEGIGSRSVTIGDTSCGVRLNYEVTATRQ